MGNSNRPITKPHVRPGVGRALEESCPRQFRAVRIFALTSVEAGESLSVQLIDNEVRLEGEASIALVLEPAKAVLAALDSGCGYVASVAEAIPAGDAGVVDLDLT